MLPASGKGKTNEVGKFFLRQLFGFFWTFMTSLLIAPAANFRLSYFLKLLSPPRVFFFREIEQLSILLRITFVSY